MKKYGKPARGKRVSNPKTENWDGRKQAPSKENKGFGPCHYAKHKN